MSNSSPMKIGQLTEGNESFEPTLDFQGLDSLLVSFQVQAVSGGVISLRWSSLSLLITGDGAHLAWLKIFIYLPQTSP